MSAMARDIGRVIEENKRLKAENETLLVTLQDIEGIVRDRTYRVPGDPESPSKGARILALIRSRLGHAATTHTDDARHECFDATCPEREGQS